jgi:two-component system, OmpR family, KDP operon response regulator KdpE
MPADRPKILIIEDEQEIRRFLRASLAAHEYRFIEADSGQQGLMLAASQQPDLIVLDLWLPDMDGIDLIPRIREWSGLPIIILSARGQERDKIAALDAGADDYLTKPFGIGELLARIRVALRHTQRGGDADSPVFKVGQLVVDLSSRQIIVGGREVHLTPTEFRLLATLIRHAGKVVTHRHLLNEVWGPDSLDETHSLRVYMAKLRDKLEEDSARPRYLLTEAGVGYRLIEE